MYSTQLTLSASKNYISASLSEASSAITPFTGISTCTTVMFWRHPSVALETLPSLSTSASEIFHAF